MTTTVAPTRAFVYEGLMKQHLQRMNLLVWPVQTEIIKTPLAMKHALLVLILIPTQTHCLVVKTWKIAMNLQTVCAQSGITTTQVIKFA